MKSKNTTQIKQKKTKKKNCVCHINQGIAKSVKRTAFETYVSEKRKKYKEKTGIAYRRNSESATSLCIKIYLIFFVLFCFVFCCVCCDNKLRAIKF